MRMVDLTPLGRVPKGEPGYNFYKGTQDNNAVPPLQKGIAIAPESMKFMEEIAPAGFLEGGDYVVYGGYLVDTVDGEDGPEEVRTQEHVVVALRHDEAFAWLVQIDKVLQQDAAKDLMGPDFRWTLLKPESVILDMSRAMARAKFMYPEIKKLAVVVDMGDGPSVQSMDGEFAEFIKQALLRE